MPIGRGALLALLLLLPSAAAPVLAQAEPPPAGGPRAAAFEALPAELRAVGFRWLDAANATLQGATGPNASAVRTFRDGAWDFLNESRLTLAMTQLYQVEVVAAHDRFLAQAPEDRREALLARMDAEANATRPRFEAFVRDASAFEGDLRTTHAVEYGLLAMLTALEANLTLGRFEQARETVAGAPVVDDGIVFFGHLNSVPAPRYVAWAEDLLALARQANEGPRPAAPADALLRMHARIDRLRLDASTFSTTGPASSALLQALEAANRTGPELLVTGSFLAFQEARALDALEFLRSRGGLSDAVLADGLRTVVENQSLVPRYDGRVLVDVPPGPLPRAEEAGYLGVLGRDARNHAQYRLVFDPAFRGVAQAWAQLAEANQAAELLAEARASREAAGDLVLVGGIAVAAALAVVAFALLRRP